MEIQISRLYHQMECVTNGTHSSQTEIPNRNFLKFFVHGKRPLSLVRTRCGKETYGVKGKMGE